MRFDKFGMPHANILFNNQSSIIPEKIHFMIENDNSNF